MKYTWHITKLIILLVVVLSISHPAISQSWTQLISNGDTSSAPPPRNSHTVIYDSNNNRMTIFGGYDGVINNDVWVLSTANGLGGTPTWTRLFPTGSAPTTRLGNTAVYDMTNNKMTIFGGYSYNVNIGYGALNDVWVLSNANGLDSTTSTWTQLLPIGSAPTTRLNHTAIYDPINNRMTIFGGYFENYTHDLNDVWVLSNANDLDSTTSAWTQLFPTGSAPVERGSHSVVYDAINNRMIIFGGESADSIVNDVWVLSNANGLGGNPVWTQIFPTGSAPPARYGHTAVYDNIKNRMTIFGGAGDYGLLNDVWVLSYANGLGGTPVWTQILPTGSTPTMRWFHTAIYDNTNNRMTIFGGDYWNGSQFIDLNDVWVLSNADVLPPNLINLPSLKLFTSQSLNPAFDLYDYNFAGIATTYSIVSNFLTLSTLTGSTVYQASYSIATVGTNIYEADNTYGSSTASNEVKYSTYKIRKLPHVGLTPGSSWDVDISSYTYSSIGLSIPPSFGNPSAIIVSDTSSIFATWSGNTIVHITSLQAFSGPVDVDVTASPNATSPYGIDIDKERIQVYTNLLPKSTFSTSNDTSIWMPLELAPGRTTLATQSWISTYTDSAGTKANGVWSFHFPDGNTGVQSTPVVSNWINITNGQWYTYRIRLVADTPNNSHQALLFGYTNLPGSGTQTDIVGNVLFGVPTVWTWQEAPLLAHGSSTTGYPQFQFKAGTAGSIYVDEIQILNATPTLINARSNTKSHYLYGQFTIGNDTTGWGQQVYFGAGSAPGISVNNGLVLNFAGATSGSGQEGIKWTANNGVQGSGHAYSFPVNQNHDVNVGLTLSIQSGNFNSLGIVLAAAYGIQTVGQQDIGTPPSNLIASAGVGVLNNGNYSAEGVAINPYYQGQFGVRSDKPGILIISNVDVNVDNDDPNFGDATLFP